MAAMELILKEDLLGVDWDRLAEVYRAAFGGTLDAERTRSIFGRCYLTRIALLDGAEVGGVYALCDGELDAAIYGLAVHPGFHRRGIGTALMRSAIEGLPPQVAVMLTADEPWLVEFYRELGFARLQTAMALRFPEHAVD